MQTQRFDTRQSIFYLFWICFLAAALIILPNYLGLLISKNQWAMMGLMAVGTLVITLYFSDFRHQIFFTALFISFANSRIYGVAQVFGTLRWIFLGAMAVSAISNWILGRIPTRFRQVDLWAAGFLALAFYSQTYSIMPSMTFERSVSAVIFYLAVFWGVWNYAGDDQKTIAVIHELCKASFILFLLGFTFIGNENRFTSFFGNPNAVGVMASILVPLALWSYLCERKPFSLWFLVLVLTSLFLSRSRTGILSASVGTAYFLFQYFRTRRTVLLTAVVFFVGASFLYAEMFNSILVKEYFRWESLSSASGRYEAWREVLRLIWLRPWLGYGFGTEDYLFKAFDIVFYEHAGAYAHNSYIGLVSQVGIIGALVFFIPIALFFFNRAYRVYRAPPGELTWLEAALNASILGGLANALFESWLYSAGSAFAFPFWCLVAAALRANHRREL